MTIQHITFAMAGALCVPLIMSAQSIRFTLPIEGVRGRDFFVVNGVDHDSSSGIRDYNCGTHTYNGHQGTDFVLRSFRQMDSGVNVLSAASGRVFAVVDTSMGANRLRVELTNIGVDRLLVELYDASGRKISTVFDEVPTSSILELTMPDAPQSACFLRISAGRMIATMPFATN